MLPEQCRAVHAGLQLSQKALARAANVSNLTIEDFESGRIRPVLATLRAVKAALEVEGAVFEVGGSGVGVSARADTRGRQAS